MLKLIINRLLNISKAGTYFNSISDLVQKWTDLDQYVKEDSWEALECKILRLMMHAIPNTLRDSFKLKYDEEEKRPVVVVALSERVEDIVGVILVSSTLYNYHTSQLIIQEK